MNNKVKYVACHETIFVPTLGNLGAVFATDGSKFSDINLSASDHGVYVTIKQSGKTGEFLIPYVQCKVVVYDTASKVGVSAA